MASHYLAPRRLGSHMAGIDGAACRVTMATRRARGLRQGWNGRTGIMRQASGRGVADRLNIFRGPRHVRIGDTVVGSETELAFRRCCQCLASAAALSFMNIDNRSVPCLSTGLTF